LMTLSINELRLHFLALLSKAAKKLRLAQAQAKKRVQKLRLRLLPYESSFLEPQTVLQVEFLFSI
jgi:hypothetical protein